MAFGPPAYNPPGLEQILAQLDNAAVLERARNVGLGDLMGGGGAAMPFNPGSVPMNAGYATGAANMPYGYGSLETPTTEALLEAMRRRGPYAGGRGFLKGTGAPLGLPRASSAVEVGAGIYGGSPSAINANVIPVTQPSPIPPGAGRGAGAANMPYAQWQQASDELVSAVQRQGPYAGTRGWGRSSGPAYVAETGFPRQVALPQYAESLRIPNQTGLAGSVNEVPVARPGSIPQGAGRGAGAGSMPYASEAIPMGPVYEAPVRQSTLRNALRNGEAPAGRMSFSTPSGALADSVAAIETPVTISGRSGPAWQSFQGGSNGVGAAGFPTADYVAPAATEAAAGATGIRGMLGGATGGMRGAARDAFSPRSGASNMGTLGRAGLALGIGIGGGALADKAGGSDTVAGQFLEGASQGGSFGAIGGLPGAIVGGLGVGIGNVASHAIQGRGIESILGGEEGGLASGPIGDYLNGQQVQTATGETGFTPEAQIVMGLIDPEVNVYAQLGIPDDVASEMKDKYNRRLAATDDQTERVNIVKEAANELLDYTETGGASAQQMSPGDIASMQIMASQMMAPVAADSVALGNMQASALQGLQGTLPEAYRQPVQQMIDQAVPHSQRVANAYMQQAYAMPQLNVLDQYQNTVNQTAQQLTAQALAGGNGTGPSSGGDLASLIAGATGGDPNSSADIVSALAGG